MDPQTPVGLDPHHHLAGVIDEVGHELMEAADALEALRQPSSRQLVTTFNEFGEGTAVESSREWATRSGYGAYLDVLHGV